MAPPSVANLAGAALWSALLSLFGACTVPHTPLDASHALWLAGSHPMGRGRMRPENVIPKGAGFSLRIQPASCDGAEVRSRASFGDGEFTARMRTPHAPGSLSAFFLYEDEGEKSDEIDIEIFNDGSRRILLTAWTAGEVVRQENVTLPFDPALAMHSYTIRRRGRTLTFLVDGDSGAAWDGYETAADMHVVANLWWPRWLDCTPPAAASELEIERIMIVGTR